MMEDAGRAGNQTIRRASNKMLGLQQMKKAWLPTEVVIWRLETKTNMGTNE